LLAEQVADYKGYWGEKPDPDTLATFKHRAMMDAWATVRHDRKTNPARKSAARKPAAKRAYVNRPSQATKKPPTKRLKARRAANVRGSGMFPNPKPRWAFDVQDADKGIYSVHSRTGKGYVKVAEFRDYNHAVEYAEAYANAHNKQMRVTGNLGKAGSKAKSGIINRNW